MWQALEGKREGEFARGAKSESGARGGGGVLRLEFTGFPKLHSHGPSTCVAYWHDSSFSDDLRQIQLEVRVLRSTKNEQKNWRGLKG